MRTSKSAEYRVYCADGKKTESGYKEKKIPFEENIQAA